MAHETQLSREQEILILLHLKNLHLEITGAGYKALNAARARPLLLGTVVVARMANRVSKLKMVMAGLGTMAVALMGMAGAKVGGEYRAYQFYRRDEFTSNGTFDFSRTFTRRDPLSGTGAVSGNAFASFLLGLPASGSVDTPSPSPPGAFFRPAPTRQS